MSLIDDIRCKPTMGELALRDRAATAQTHAEAAEDKLLIVDPEEAHNPAVHSRVCYERQAAAHCWRRANSLQSQLNGAENRRYFRSLSIWMCAGFATSFLKGSVSLASLGELLKLLLGGG